MRPLLLLLVIAACEDSAWQHTNPGDEKLLK